MKTRIQRIQCILTALTLLAGAQWVAAQAIDDANTILSYQGQIIASSTNNAIDDANTILSMTFTLFSTNSGGGAMAGPITNSVTVNSNGLFYTTLNFGSNIFNGSAAYLEVAVATNVSGTFTTLSPRQPITPAPQAYYAGSAGTAAVATTAASFSGPVSGDVSGTQGATVVTSVGGQPAANIASATVAANAATSANVPNTIVARDGTGSFSAGSVTLGGLLNLPFPAVIFSGTNTMLIESGSYYTGAGAGAADYARPGWPVVPDLLNVGVGDGALNKDNVGTANTAIGEQSLQFNTTGTNNTAGGYQAMQHNTTGSNNKADGYQALFSNTTGNNNTANGSQALYSNTNGYNNTANGVKALYYNSAGTGNTADGVDALNSNTTGYNNTAAGISALAYNTTGYFNTASGSGALQFNTTGIYNTANGMQALDNNTNGSFNTASGAYALSSNATGSNNVANGYEAMQNNTTGIQNTANGEQTLFNNTTGNFNTASGAQALFSNTTGIQNTADGLWSLFSNLNGLSNTGIGYDSLYYNTTGSLNTAVGVHALINNTSGSNNIAVGTLSGDNLTTGNNNIDVGNEGVAGEANTIRIGTTNIHSSAYVAGIWGTTLGGSPKTVVVDNSGHLGATTSAGGVTQVTGSGDIIVSPTTGNVVVSSDATSFNTPNTIVRRDSNGDFSADNVNANNVDLGGITGCSGQTGVLNLPATTATSGMITLGGCTSPFLHGYGSANFFGGLNAGNFTLAGANNVGVGYTALGNLASGSDNTAIGANAFSLNDGGDNTAIGYQALMNASGANNIAVGSLAGQNLTAGNNNIYIGNQGAVNESDTIRIGSVDNASPSNAIASTYIGGIYNSTVTVGVPVYVLANGQLGTLTSSARYKQNIKTMADASDVLLALRPVTYQYKPGLDPKGSPQFGLIAEEVDKVDPDLVVHDKQHGIYTVRYEAVNAMLLNEFLKQHQKVEEQNQEIKSLKEKAAKVDSLESRLDELQAMVKQLAAQK